jgi:hypothetical protein
MQMDNVKDAITKIEALRIGCHEQQPNATLCSVLNDRFCVMKSDVV